MIFHNGKEYARVSDILKPFCNFDHIDPFVLQNKANIGTRVHEAIADDVVGDFPCPGIKGIGYFESYVKWKESVKPLFVLSEKRMFCDEKMITGQIDGLIEVGSKVVLVDFKTSVKESKETWPMQAHLYAHLLRANGFSFYPEYHFVKLNKLGLLPDIFEYKYCPIIHKKCMDSIDKFWKLTENDSHKLS